MRVRIAIFGLLLSRVGFGWGDVGHGAVGDIAQRYITEDTKKFIQSILGPEPLAVSAVFPDHVRSDKRFKGFDPYHFVEIPNGTEYEPTKGHKDGNVFLSQGPSALRSNEVSRERKALYLRYIVHIAGDVHQPLHVGNGQDMGANLCDAKWVEPFSYGRKVTEIRNLNLHTIWDENIIDGMKEESKRKAEAEAKAKGIPLPKRYFGSKELADWALEEAKPTAEDVKRIGEPKILEWYSESRKLHSAVYLDPETEPIKRKYCKYQNPKTHKVENGAYDPKAVPTLDEQYYKRTAPVVRNQILKGGIRLARLLNDIASGQKSDVEKEMEVLESTQLTN